MGVVAPTAVGQLIASRRRALGLSQRQLAERLREQTGVMTVTRDEVKRWESGKRAPTAWLVPLAHALGLGVDELLAAAPDPVRTAHEWLVTDSPALVQTRSGRRIGVELAGQLEQRVIELRHLDDTVGGRDLAPLVEQEMGTVADLVDGAVYTERVGKRLLTVLGELGQLAGWTASDAGQHRHAQQLYLEGLRAAEAARNRPLGGQLLSSLAYQIANSGRPADALLIARTAVRGVNSASPKVVALLTERVAWSAARSRDVDATLRALDRVDTAFQDAGHADEPEWVYWLDQAEIDVMRARCLIAVGRASQAEPLLASVLAQYPVEHPREAALYLTWLAEAYVQLRQFDAARSVVDQITTLGDTGSARVTERLAVISRLTPP